MDFEIGLNKNFVKRKGSEKRITKMETFFYVSRWNIFLDEGYLYMVVKYILHFVSVQG